jgi:GntR family transcriptional regulator
MPSPSVDKRSDVPLYRQLFKKMAQQIADGTLKPGERLPSERELAEIARVSRTTARLAIDELVANGLVYREQGKGTFLAQPHMRGLMGFASFSEDVIARGMKPHSIVLRQEVQKATPEIAERLKLPADSDVLNLVRLRLADDSPIALQYSFLPLHLVPELDKFDLEDKSLFTTLREEYGLYPSWTEAEVEAIEAPEETKKHLDLHKGAPVLVVRGLTYTDSFELVESVETIYRGQGLALYIGRQRFTSF